MSTPTKFYHAENANRIIRAGGQQFQFTPYQHLGGSWYGVLKTEVPTHQAALDELSRDKQSAVTVIDETEYQRCLQKKAHNDQRSGILNAPQPPAPTITRLEDALVAGSPVTSELPTPAPTGAPALNSLADALSVGSVTTGAPEVQPAELRQDGPTVEEWVTRGYKAENYPPQGYAPKPSAPIGVDLS